MPSGEGTPPASPRVGGENKLQAEDDSTHHRHHVHSIGARVAESLPRQRCTRTEAGQTLRWGAPRAPSTTRINSVLIVGSSLGGRECVAPCQHFGGGRGRGCIGSSQQWQPSAAVAAHMCRWVFNEVVPRRGVTHAHREPHSHAPRSRGTVIPTSCAPSPNASTASRGGAGSKCIQTRHAPSWFPKAAYAGTQLNMSW